VKCGLCLPHCPTYRLYRNENESPRGRISLAEALLRGELSPDTALRGHIDRCLLCRACENNCPSGVRYAEIIDTARAAMGGSTGAGAWIDNPLVPFAGRLARGLHLPGLLGRLARALPAHTPLPTSGTHRPPGASRGRVGLLLGCATRTQQAGALAASVELLQRLGFTVEIPQHQTCCGALAAHQGDPEQAHAQVARNREAFAGVESLVSIASACSLQLTKQLPDHRVYDMVQFLAENLPDSGLRFSAPDGRVALHIPCTLHNGLHATWHLERVLEFLPGDPPAAIGNPGDCCGAGGAQMLTQRNQAVQLREPFLQRLLELQPRYLLTENIGCALHLAEGAMARGLKIEVLHPVELLLGCLDLQGSDSIEWASTRRRFGP
jgi:glycolate oxidase iron-sulfur subunit